MELRIREWRKRRGLTLRVLAERIGSSEATLSRMETDRIRVTTAWLERIAAALEVSPTDLLADAPRPAATPIVAELDGRAQADAAPGGAFDLTDGMRDPVACRVLEDTPPFIRGDHLIGDRCDDDALAPLAGRLVFGVGEGGDWAFGRLAASDDAATYFVVPEGGRAPPRQIKGFVWVAAVKWVVRPADG